MKNKYKYSCTETLETTALQKPGPAMADEPSVSITRRRGRPFTEMEATVVAQDDADYANDLIEITRQLEGETAEQAQRNS